MFAGFCDTSIAHGLIGRIIDMQYFMQFYHLLFSKEDIQFVYVTICFMLYAFMLLCFME